MKDTYKYKISNSDKFVNDFIGIVDTSVSCRCHLVDPSLLKAEYFGKVEAGEFSISHKNCKVFMTGNIKDNELTVIFHFPGRFNSVFDIVIFTLVGLSIIYDLNLYLGLAVILFVIIQKLIVFSIEEKIKNAFLNKIEEMNK